jgi:hypothetical protein
VHIDFGLVVPMLSVRGMRCAVSDLLDLAPVNKVTLFQTLAKTMKFLVAFSVPTYPSLEC